MPEECWKIKHFLRFFVTVYLENGEVKLPIFSIAIIKKTTKKQKAGTLAATTIGTALSALGQEVAKTVVIANADEYVSSLTDEQLAQACELLDGERNISVEEIAQHINDLDTKQVATDVKTKSL